MKTLRQLLQDFRGAKRKTETLQNNLPRIIGVEAVAVVRQNFDKQGYDTGTGFTPWARRADVTNQAYDYNRTANSQKVWFTAGGRAIGGKSQFVTSTGKKSRAKNQYKGSVVSSANPLLMQTRTLYRGITYFTVGKGVTIGVDPSLVIYAQKMNEGGKGRWGGKANTNTPRRQYMPFPNDPPNKKILDAVKKKVEYEQYRAMDAFHK